jgi:type I restriction enzyme, S subunit
MADRSLCDGDIPWVTPKDMKRFTISSASMQVSAKALAATSLRLIRSESVLLVVRGMILARRVPVARTDRPVTINQDMKAIVPVAGIDAGYLAYLIDDAQGAFVPLIDEAGHGTKRLPTERWKDLQFAFPDLAEQRLIVAFLDSQGGQCARLVKGVETIAREIDALQDFRARLIADVVTGKLDVRDPAHDLPEIADLDTESFEELSEADDPDDGVDVPESAEAAA